MTSKTNLITANELRENLTRERQAMGMSLREVSEQCGVSASTLSRIEQGKVGKSLDMDTIARVCEWLGRNVDPNEQVVSETGIDAICRVIRADPNLEDPEPLCELMRTAYESLARH